MENTSAKTRNAGLDLLRIVAMCMIVVLHYLGKGNLLADMSKADSWTATNIVAWFLESVCVVAVNLYMLTSGYLLSAQTPKLSRLFSLYIQLWAYSFGIGMLAQAFNLVPAKENDFYHLLITLLPVSMVHYWYITAYFFLYLLLPLLSIAVKKMTRKQHLACTILLIFFVTVLKSVLPVVLENDNEGYDFLWYIVLFLVAAYIRKYNPKFASVKVCIPLYLIGLFGSFFETLVLGKVCEKTGSLTLILHIAMHYNHIFPLLASVGLFGLFIKIKINGVASKIISFVAPLTLGVYLLHENMRVRYLWPNWLGADKVSGIGSLLWHTALAILVVFVLGIVVEFIRSKLFGLIDKGFMFIPPYKKLKELIKKVDLIFAEEKN